MDNIQLLYLDSSFFLVFFGNWKFKLRGRGETQMLKLLFFRTGARCCKNNLNSRYLGLKWHNTRDYSSINKLTSWKFIILLRKKAKRKMIEYCWDSFWSWGDVEFESRKQAVHNKSCPMSRLSIIFQVYHYVEETVREDR